MSIIKRYDLKGLNLRSSNINRDPKYASEVKNVQLNDKKEIVKRYGFNKVTDSVGVDLQEYYDGEELIQVKSNGLYRIVDGAPIKINFSGEQITITSIDSEEYNGVMYFTDPDGINDLYKYDGKTVYRAGVPKPVTTTAAGAGSFYYRTAYGYRDVQGNITYGDYTEHGPLADNASFTFPQMGSGFYEKYASVTDNPVVISASVNTVNVLIGHNYIKGDWIILGGGSGDTNVVEITSTTSTSITMDTSLIGLNTYQIFSGLSLERRTSIHVWKSADETFGFETGAFSNPVFDYGLNIDGGTASNSAGTGSFMDDVYDTTIIKGLPPRCRYIGFNNNVMILANNSDSSFTNFLTSITDLASSFYWSDLGIGSTVETFPPFNTDTAGRSFEGDITGIWGGSDNVIVLKERQIYYVNGNLTLATYRIRSALTNEVGCVSHRSILGVLGGCLFMSSRGMYLASSGGMPIEISDRIEPLFRRNKDLNLYLSKTINDSANEKLYIHIPYISKPLESMIAVYDYLFKEWFIFEDINGVNGLSMLVDDMYHCDDTTIYKRSNSYNDNLVPIDAYYKSSWEDQGFPTVTKKFKKVTLITTDQETWDASVKTQNDWLDIDVTDEVIKMVGPMVDDVSVNMTQKKSMRVVIGNNILDQGIHITGYELDVEATQTRSKGES